MHVVVCLFLFVFLRFRTARATGQVVVSGISDYEVDLSHPEKFT
jgi:hypothetical protein